MTGAHGRIAKPIVLVGFMAAGKSTIGRMLAQRLGLPFADSDEVIEAELGMSVADIFRVRGEGSFRAAERAAIVRLLRSGPSVMAIGGGAFVDQSTREALGSRALTVWLDPPFELIHSRLSRSTARPVAAGQSKQTLLALWEKRRKFYAEAQIHIRSSDEPTELVDRIVTALERHAAARSS